MFIGYKEQYYLLMAVIYHHARIQKCFRVWIACMGVPKDNFVCRGWGWGWEKGRGLFSLFFLLCEFNKFDFSIDPRPTSRSAHQWANVWQLRIWLERIKILNPLYMYKDVYLLRAGQKVLTKECYRIILNPLNHKTLMP